MLHSVNQQMQRIEKPESLKVTARAEIKKLLVTARWERSVLYSTNTIADILGVSCGDSSLRGRILLPHGLVVIPAAQAGFESGPLGRRLLQWRKIALQLIQDWHLTPGGHLKNLPRIWAGEAELAIAPVEPLAQRRPPFLQ